MLYNDYYFALPDSQPCIDPNRPYITSNCPGCATRLSLTHRWVCYAEKKAHTLVPLLSTVQSAQQIMGALLRTLLPRHTATPLTSADIFITSVASCYDRKLVAVQVMSEA